MAGLLAKRLCQAARLVVQVLEHSGGVSVDGRCEAGEEGSASRDGWCVCELSVREAMRVLGTCWVSLLVRRSEVAGGGIGPGDTKILDAADFEVLARTSVGFLMRYF